MENLEELSDAEIAEMVAREMGWRKPGSGEDIYVWLIEKLELPDEFYGVFSWDLAESSEQETIRFACFDWPAPLMMAKVKERLRTDYEVDISNCKIDKTITVGVRGPDPEEFWIAVEASTEPRALYEAFLQVMEEPNEKP